MRKQQQQVTTTRKTTTTTPQRSPINEMTDDVLHTWIRTTRAALQKKMDRERNYLERRAARGTHTPTDEAYEGDQSLLADLMTLLDEMEASV